MYRQDFLSHMRRILLTVAFFLLIATTANVSVVSSSSSSPSSSNDSVDHNSQALLNMDYGDLRSNGGTLLQVADPARHLIVPEYFLGLQVDLDAGNSGNDDDNDDGISFPSEMHAGESINIDVTASQAEGVETPNNAYLGHLSGWIDFNNDGDFDDAHEQVISDVTLTGPFPQTISIEIPEDAVVDESVISRFRYSTQLGLGPFGLAYNGEVEDYFLEIEANAPDAPHVFTVREEGASSVRLNWNNVANETGYEIFFNGGLAAQEPADRTTTVLTSIDCNENTYGVRAINDEGSSDTTTTTFQLNCSAGPPAPNVLNVRQESDTHVRLNWSNVVGETGFNVYVDDVLTTVVDVDRTTTVLNIGDCDNHTYGVTAFDGLGESSPTTADFQIVCATEPPNAPNVLNARLVNSASIRLNWSNVANETGHAIYVDGVQIATELPDRTTYVVPASDCNQHTYGVAAFNGAGSSAITTVNFTLNPCTGSPPNAPGVLNTRDHDSTRVRLNWSNVSDESNFEVFVNGSLVQTVDANRTTAIVDAPDCGSNTYGVRAINIFGQSTTTTANYTLGTCTVGASVPDTPSNSDEAVIMPGRIEAEDARITRLGTWVEQATSNASGGAYVYSDGNSEDALTFDFVGTGIQVVYVGNPVLGTLNVEIDGVRYTTDFVTATESNTFGLSATTVGLDYEQHTVRIFAGEGTIAIDEIVIID